MPRYKKASIPEYQCFLLLLVFLSAATPKPYQDRDGKDAENDH